MFKKRLLLGLALAISTVASQVSSAQIITSIERRNSTNTYPQIAGPLEQYAGIFVDRNYEYDQIPAALVGAEYIKVANNDKKTQYYELDVTLSQDATMYLLLDNRLGHGSGQGGKSGLGWNPYLSSAGMDWVVLAGFVDTGDDLSVHEYGTSAAYRWMSVYAKDVSVGTIPLLQQYDASTDRGRDRNMYGVAVVPEPTTLLLLGLGGLMLRRKYRR